MFMFNCFETISEKIGGDKIRLDVINRYGISVISFHQPTLKKIRWLVPLYCPDQTFFYIKIKITLKTYELRGFY